MFHNYSLTGLKTATLYVSINDIVSRDKTKHNDVCELRVTSFMQTTALKAFLQSVTITAL